MDISSFICPEDIRLATFLYILQEAEYCVMDLCPIPPMAVSLDSLGTGCTFWTLHKNSVFWQNKVDDPDKDRRTLTSHCTLRRFL